MKYFDRAIDVLTQTINMFHNTLREQKGQKPKDYSFLFLLDGTRVKNLLDIPNDSAVLIISDKPIYVGVEFEEIEPISSKEKTKSALGQMIRNKSMKFCNNTI